MKNQLMKLGGVLMISALLLGSCKKGEDDPFLSLKSRDARITGTWELVDYTAEYKDSDGTFTREYDGTQMTETDEDGVEETNNYSETLTIEKDGSFTVVIITDETITRTGHWWWLNDGKNKTRIAFDDDFDSFDIIRLKNKELVISQSDSYESVGYNSSYNSKSVYQKK